MTERERAVVEAARELTEYAKNGGPDFLKWDTFYIKLVLALRDLDAEKCEACGGARRVRCGCGGTCEHVDYKRPCPTCGGSQ